MRLLSKFRPDVEVLCTHFKRVELFLYFFLVFIKPFKHSFFHQLLSTRATEKLKYLILILMYNVNNNNNMLIFVLVFSSWLCLPKSINVSVESSVR